ncbi:hypothetical protein NFJ02_39g97700 [Pycnococcus provasolii]
MSANINSESNSFVVRLALFINGVEFCDSIESFLTERVPAMGLRVLVLLLLVVLLLVVLLLGCGVVLLVLLVLLLTVLLLMPVLRIRLRLHFLRLAMIPRAEGIKDDAEFRDRCEEAAGEDAACDQFLSFLIASWEFEAFVKLAKDFLKELTAKFERLPETTGAGEVDLDNLPDGDLEDDDGNILDVPSPKTHALSDERLADDVANLGL